MSKNIPQTEQTFKKSKPIDHLSTANAISLMIEEHRSASLDVFKSAKSIEIAVQNISTFKSKPKRKVDICRRWNIWKNRSPRWC